jgi:transketolase
MRGTFGEVLGELADKDNKIFMIDSDYGSRIRESFIEKHPDKHINGGICEQALISMSAGMALSGFKPYVYTIASFFERAFEQLKIDINQQKAKVVLVGFGDYPLLGPTHKPIDWNLLKEQFSNLKFYFPETKEDVKKALLESYEYDGPSFIMLKNIKE